MKYISKELALWLRDKGCRLPTDKAYYGNAGIWHDALVDLDGYVSASQEFRDAKLLLAYSWYDILVTHFEAFWWPEGIKTSKFEHEKRHYGACSQCIHDWRVGEIMRLLRESKFAEAEAYVRERSFFSIG